MINGRIKKWVAGMLVVVMLLPYVSLPNYKKAEAVVENPSFQKTDYGVQDDRVVAHCLELSDNEEIIETGEMDLIFVKEQMDERRVRLHIYGVKGLIYTYELESDNEWLRKIEEGNSTINYVNSGTGTGHTNLYTITNPNTGKTDVINVATSTYYLYGLESSGDIAAIGNNEYAGNKGTDDYINDSYDPRIDEKISWHSYRKDKKIGIADASGKKITDAEYDDCTFKNGSVLLGKNRISEDGNIDGTDWRLLKSDGEYGGKYVNILNISYEEDWIYAEKEDGTRGCVNIITGKEYGFDKYTFWKEHETYMLVIKEKEEHEAWVYDEYLKLEGSGSEASNGIIRNRKSDSDYFVISENEGVVNLKEKLGVDILEIDDQRGTEDSIYITGYNILGRNLDGILMIDYAFRGYVGKDGEIIYGYDTNEELKWDVIWWNGDYGIIKNCQVDNNTDSNKREYKVIDKNGKEIYQYTDENRSSYNNSASVKNYGNEFLVFEIDEKKVTLDLKKRKLLPDDNLYVINYSRTASCALDYTEYFWQTKQGKFIIIQNKEDQKYGILNIDNGKKYYFDFDVFGGHNIEIYEDFKERTLIKAENVFEDREVMLNANMESINIPSSYDSGSCGSQVLGNCIYNKNGVVYDFSRKEILRNTYARASVYYNMYNSQCMVPVYQDEFEWTYCNAKGDLLSDFDYKSVSEFVCGLAWGECSGDGDDCAKVIDYNGNVLVRLIDPWLEEIYDRLHNGRKWLPELYGKGIILSTGGSNIYFYDLSDISIGDEETQEGILESQDRDRSALLENAENIEDFTFNGMKTKFIMPDDVPILGGGEISLDFDKVPVLVQKSGNTFRIGLGVEEEEKGEKKEEVKWYNPKTWKSLKSIVEDQKSDIEKGNSLLKKLKEGKEGSVSTPITKKVKSKVYGYLEGTIKDGQIESNTGRLVIEMKASASKKWQTAVVSVPIVLSAKGEVGVTADYALTVDWQEAMIKGEGDVEFVLPSVTLSAGVGVAYIADVSVYGKMTNTLEIEMKAQEDADIRVKDYLDGEMGVSVSLLLASYEKSLLKAKRKMVFDSNNGVVTSKKSTKKLAIDEDEYKIQRDYVSETSEWHMSEEESSGAASNMQILQEDVYSQANPQIVCDNNGTKIMTFITDIEGRSTGNHTAVVYSLYDEQNKQWTEPILVDDDGTADMHPQLATDGEKTYLVWVNTRRDDFTENTSVSEMARECEISVAVYDSIECKFKDITTLTDDLYADICPSLFVNNGEAYVSWISNLNNDLIGMTGTNVIKYATNKSGIWETTNYQTLEMPVTTAQIGMFQNNISIAYLSDVDGNIMTPDDLEAYVGKVGGQAKKIATEKTGKQTLQFIELDNKNALAFSTTDGFWYTNDTVEYSCLFENEAQSNMKYECIPGESSDLLICCEAGEDGVNLHGYLYRNGVLSEEIPITDQKQYIQQPSGFYDNGKFNFVFTRTTTNISKEKVSSSTDICAMEFGKYQDLKTEELYVAEESVVPGGKGELQVTVTNNGFYDEKNFTVYVYAGEIELGNYTYNENLAVGESKNISVEFNIPENFSAGTKISCQVNAQGDANDSNNTIESVIGKENVSLEVFSKERDNKGTEGVVYITNTSGYVVNPTLRIYEGSKDGKLLKTESLGQLNAGEIKRLIYPSDMLTELIEDDSTLYFEVSVNGEEQYLLDNYAYLYVSHVGNVTPSDPGQEKDAYIWQGEYTGWGGPDSYPSSANHDQGNGEDNVTYTNLTNMRVSSGYACGLELMNPYNPAFTGAENEMAQFIKKMKNPRIKVTLENGGTASSWNWDTELSFPSAKEIKLPSGYLDNGYFVLFGNDDVITKVEIYDVKESDSTNITSPSPTVTVAPTINPRPGGDDNGNTGNQNSDRNQTKNTTTKSSNANYSKSEKVKKPGKVTGLDLTYEGKKLFISWNWKSNVSGFQIQYALNKKFTKKKKTKSVGKYAQDKTIRGLKKKKTYYVRIRAYKKVSGKKIYGKWSKIKKIKTKQ